MQRHPRSRLSGPLGLGRCPETTRQAEGLREWVVATGDSSPWPRHYSVNMRHAALSDTELRAVCLYVSVHKGGSVHSTSFTPHYNSSTHLQLCPFARRTCPHTLPPQPPPLRTELTILTHVLSVFHLATYPSPRLLSAAALHLSQRGHYNRHPNLRCVPSSLASTPAASLHRYGKHGGLC